MPVLCCTRCGDEEVASNDLIPGLALGQWVDGQDGAPTFDGYGETKVCWDRQQPVVGEEAYCRSCDWSGPCTDLVPAAPELL
jgi:hypothetical protein